MKKRFVIAALLSAVVATPSFAADTEGKVYAGIRAGQSNLTNSPIGFGVFGGYTIFEPNTFKGKFFSKLKISVEGEYMDHGSANYSIGSVKASSIGASAVAKYPFNSKFSALVSAGLARTTVDTTIAPVTFFGTTIPGSSTTSTSFGLHGGVAGEYNVIPEVTLRAGYDFYPNSVNMLSAAAIYNF